MVERFEKVRHDSKSVSKDEGMPSARSSALTEETRKRVINLYKAGTTTAAITEQTGVTRGTIYWILEQAGVEKNRTKKPAADALELTGRVAENSNQVARLQQACFEQQLEIGRLMGRIEALETLVTKLVSP